MKYMWSKNRIAKYLLPIILKDRKPNQWYVEPFVWGANMIDKVEGNRIWWEYNEYIAKMWDYISKWWFPKKEYTREEYLSAKIWTEEFWKYEIWYIGIACSYSGKWFWWYAWKTKTKLWTIRDYQNEAYNNIMKQRVLLQWVKFIQSSYQNLEIPKNSIIYCDPPYESTTWYKDDFSHNEFWDWCREQKKKWHTIFISEYNAPDDFKCVWEKEVKSSLSANWKSWGSKNSTEKLFTL